MKITKFGHSCVLVEDHHTRVLFDPGAYSELPDQLPDLHAAIITHKHADHLSIENLSLLAKASPEMVVICNSEVAQELANLDFKVSVLEEGQTAAVGHLEVAAYGHEHATIHPDIPSIANTGYMINNLVWHPGDSLLPPPVPVDILLLPIVAPWSKISETIDCVTTIQPKVVIPIHDGFLKFGGPYYAMIKQVCSDHNIEFFEAINYQAYVNEN
jgi:L-ascorbate metabolism protein UlaG (beta-lactamase superfamily)